MYFEINFYIKIPFLSLPLLPSLLLFRLLRLPSLLRPLRPSFPFSSSSSLSSGAPLAPPSSSALPPSSSSSPGDFGSFQASVLGLSAEYQALGRWFVASGGDDFPSYLSAHFPHLTYDFRVDFSSGSSRFLAALASSNSIPTPSSSATYSALVGPSFVTPRVPHPPPPAPLPPSVSLPWVPGALAFLYPPVASAPFRAPSSSHYSSSSRFPQPLASVYAPGLGSFPEVSAVPAVPVAPVALAVPVVSAPLF